MNYFDNYCEKQCKYKDKLCNTCPAYCLSEIMQDAIWSLENEIDELKSYIWSLENPYDEDNWCGELR